MGVKLIVLRAGYEGESTDLLRLIAGRGKRQGWCLSFWFGAIGWMVTEVGNRRTRAGLNEWWFEMITKKVNGWVIYMFL